MSEAGEQPLSLLGFRIKGQSPSTHIARSPDEWKKIIQHPAFRIGFMDAKENKPFNVDDIVLRVHQETPQSALQKRGWTDDFFSRCEKIPEMQCRYEEGRQIFLTFRPRVGKWSSPDRLPPGLRAFIQERGI